MRHSARIAVVSLLAAIGAPLGAQQTAPPANPDSVQAVTVSVPATLQQDQTPSTGGASMNGLRAGVHGKETARTNGAATTAVAAATANLGSAKAMMGVGLGALIVGAIIGGTPGTIIMIGGALVGLKGLYDYLQ